MRTCYLVDFTAKADSIQPRKHYEVDFCSSQISLAFKEANQYIYYPLTEQTLLSELCPFV